MTDVDRDMRGKVALISGGTKGIGRATAEGLARLGAAVVVVGRGREAGEATVAGIKAAGGEAEFIPADLSLMDEVRRLAGEFRDGHGRLDVLVQGADALLTKRIDTAEGIELSFATNYLSRFLLTNLLLDLMVESAPARIVHIGAPGPPGWFKTDNVLPPPGVGGFRAHRFGQRANDTFAVELSSRLRETGVTINVIKPVWVDTDIRRNMDLGPAMKRMVKVAEIVSRSRTSTPEEFARRVIYLATSPELTGTSGVLFNSKVEPVRVGPEVCDAKARRRLWETSAQLTSLYSDARTY